MRQFGKFVHDHFAVGILLAVLVPAILYKPIRDSSPVVRVTLDDGRIITLTDNGPNRWGQRSPQFRYQIELTGSGKIIFVEDPYLRLIESIVRVETITRQNGHATSRITSPPASRTAA